MNIRAEVVKAVSAARFNHSSKLAENILIQAIQTIHEYKRKRHYVLAMNPVNIEPTLVDQTHQRRGRPNLADLRYILNSAIFRAWRVGCNFQPILSNKSSSDDSKFTCFVKNIYAIAGMGKPVNSIEEFRTAKERLWEVMMQDEENWKKLE